jgi:general secretion pathway protein K
MAIRRYRGVALIAVLWMMSMLTLLATVAAATGLAHRKSVHRMAALVKAEVTADSAIRLTLLSLIARESSGHSSLDDLPRYLDLLGMRTQITSERESGRLDLNYGDSQLLVALLARSGWTASSAQQMAARIEDWTDADDSRREGGAELADYAAAGRSDGPRNAPFRSVEEVRQVLGGEQMTDEVLASLTVYSHRRLPVAPYANAQISHAMSQFQGEALSLAESSPADALPRTVSAPQSVVGETLRIQACVHLDQWHRCRRAIVRLTGNHSRPLQVFAWYTVAST